MKAAILENKGVIAYKEIETPLVAKGNVILAVKAVSICGSDVGRFVKGHRVYPLVLGHECAGSIVSVGEGADPSLLGKRAAIIPLIPDFTCEECQKGLYSACHHYSFIGSRQSGGFADYVEIPTRNVFLLPDAVSYEQGALIEPSTVARHILDLGNFTAGQTAAVLGAGSIGLMTVQWLRILGASLIICTDVIEANLEAARTLGAHVTLNPKAVDVKAEIDRLTGDGVDLTVEAAGSPQALLQTIQVTRPRGAVVCGGNQPLDAQLPMNFIEDLMRKELALRGCFMSYSAPFPGHEWTETLEATINGRLDMDAMISHRYTLAEAASVFERIADHSLNHRKIIFTPGTHSPEA